MDIFELVAKLRLDTSEYEHGLSSAGNAAQKNLGSASKALGKLNSGVDKMLKAGAVAAGAAVAGVTALGKAAVQTGMQFDSAMAQVAATMGTTVDQIGELRDFAQQMGATTAFSASQAAEALNYMALAGYDADTSMQTLPTVLNLAAAGAMDLARASDMVTDAQSALGLTLPETTAMVDQMAAAAANSNTSVAQLGDAILTIGATARNLKGGTVELTTVLGALADNGIKGAEGGTHLRNMILSLQNPTKDAAKYLNQMNISLYDSDGNMRSMIDIIGDLQTGMEGMDQASKDAIISGIFNKTDLASVNALLGTSKTRFDELTKSITNSRGAAEKMAETQLDNLAGDLTLMKSAAEGAKIAFSDGLSPALRDVVQHITAFLSKASTQKALTELGQKVGELANTISHKLTNALPRLMTLFDDGGKKVKIFGIAVAGAIIAIKAAANPVGALASALGLLVGASTLAGLTADDLVTKYSNLSQSQIDALGGVLDSIDAYHEMADERAKQNTAIDSETSKTQDLWRELQTLADKDGKVKDADKERAQYILGELNTALGTEYSMNGNIITQYKEMQDEVSKLIAMRRAEKKLQAAESGYDTALSGLSAVSEQIYNINSDIEASKSAIAEYEAELEALRAEPTPNTLGAQAKRDAKESTLLTKINGEKAVLEQREADLAKATDAERQYHEDIAEYEAAELAFSEGYYDKVSDILDNDSLNRAKHAMEVGNISQEQLNDLARDADIAVSELERYQQHLQAGDAGYTEKGFEEMQANVDEMIAVLMQGKEQLAAEGSSMGEETTGGFTDGIGGVSDAATSELNDTISDIISKRNSVATAMGEVAKAGINSWNSNMTGLKVPNPDGTGWQYLAAIGYDFVPYNNYPMMLHRGEAVLTAREAEEWRRGESGGGKVVEINQTIQSVAQTPVELAAATAAAFERARWVMA